jgi:hypothetical protein
MISISLSPLSASPGMPLVAHARSPINQPSGARQISTLWLIKCRALTLMAQPYSRL